MEEKYEINLILNLKKLFFRFVDFTKLIQAPLSIQYHIMRRDSTEIDPSYLLSSNKFRTVNAF